MSTLYIALIISSAIGLTGAALAYSAHRSNERRK